MMPPNGEQEQQQKQHQEQRRKPKLEEFPAKNKDNFRCYHDQGTLWYPVEKNNQQRGSIYSSQPDPPLEQRIVNEPKPQVTLRYLTIRGKQYSLQKSSGRSSLPSTKRRKTGHAVAS